MAAAAAGDTSALNMQGYTNGIDPSEVDMTGQLMGLTPTTASLNPNSAAAAGQNSGGVAAAGQNPATSNQVGVPPSNPSVDPKEDLKRRASVYVQQQLSMMGQPVRAGGSSSCRRDSAHAGSSSHNAGNTAYGLDPHGWPSHNGLYSASGAGYSTGATGYKKGSGRGRGRRPGQRNRYSSDDDPNDETYVPSGRHVKAEQAASRDDVTTRPREPSAGGSTMTHAYVHGTSSSMAHGMAGSSGITMQQMIAHNVTAGEYHYAMHGMHHQQHYDTDYAAVAAMAHHHISDGGGVTSSHQQQQHGAGGLTAGGAAADLVGWQNQHMPHSMQGMPHNRSAGSAGVAAGPSNSSHITSYRPSQAGGFSATMTTTAAGGTDATAAAVAAATQRTSLLGLEDTAVAYEAFRQSGGEFKMSIGCLDEFLSGVTAPPTTGSDWNALSGVGGFFRGTSLDGSRFSLTGSADAAAMSRDPRRQSSRGGTFDHHPQHQQQRQLQGFHHEGQQQHKQHHLDMPPPRCHPSHAASHGPSSQPVAEQCQQGRPVKLETSNCPSDRHTQVTSGPIHPDTAKSADHIVTQGPTQALSQATTAAGGVIQTSNHPGATQCPTQDGTQGPMQSGVTQGPSRPGVTQDSETDTSRCQSPFKAAALQQTPFSPLMDSCTPAGLHSTQTAPSSQPTQCSAGQIVGHLQQDAFEHQESELHKLQQHVHADSNRNTAARMTQMQQTTQVLPATFHSVLQALGGPSSSTAAGATGNSSKQPASASAVSTAPTAASSEVAVKLEPDAQARHPPAGVPQAGLQLQCTGDVLHRHSRASYGLLSPMGNIFADATGGCLTFDDAIGSSYNPYNHSNTDDNPQARAERRSLRLLLGVLANTPGEHQQHYPVAWSGPTAAAADPSALHAADDLTFMRRSSHGGCLGGTTYISKPSSGNSKRPSLSVVPHTGRPSQQNLGLASNQRRRVSALLTSPVGAAAKRPRLSYMGGVVGRSSSGTAEYDDCLSYWQN